MNSVQSERFELNSLVKPNRMYTNNSSCFKNIKFNQLNFRKKKIELFTDNNLDTDINKRYYGKSVLDSVKQTNMHDKVDDFAFTLNPMKFDILKQEADNNENTINFGSPRRTKSVSESKVKIFKKHKNRKIINCKNVTTESDKKYVKYNNSIENTDDISTTNGFSFDNNHNISNNDIFKSNKKTLKIFDSNHKINDICKSIVKSINSNEK